ncbi:hypothetical protein KIW84_060198 [Lathyrus oleraceus]|uniref:Uncharacterized protein n=1 Tax=Pisum sativum TaxID=3888 RepID=A0A9D4W0M1_PEA|nr:hypothetical protein KIW84_060198 [Pisum sativum]
MDNLPCECIIYVLTAIDNMSHVFSGIQTEGVSDDQVDVLMAQGQFSGIQTEGFSDDQVDVLMAQGQFSGIQTEGVSDDQVDVLMAQGQFSGIQTEGVSDDQVDVLMAQGQFSGIQAEEVSDDQAEEVSDDQVDVLMFFPVFRPKKFPTIRSMYLCFFRYSGRRSFRRSGRCTYVFSGVQTEEVSDDQVDVLMFFFRYSDRRSFRRSGRCTYVFSGVQTEEVSDDQVDVLMFFRCSDRRSFRRSGRCTYVFSGVQTEEVSDDQVDVLMFLPVYRPKKFLTIRSMYLCFFRCSDRRSFRRSGRCTYVFSGVQTEEVSDDQVDVLMFFRCSDRRSFRRSGRCTYVFSGVQTEEVSDDHVDVLMFLPVYRPKKFPTIRSMYLCFFRCSDRRSFRRSGRCTYVFSGIQAEEVSDDQVDVLMFFPVFRPKKFPTIRSMYLCFFRYSGRRSFRRSGRCTYVFFPVYRPKKFPTIRSMYLCFSGVQTEEVSDDQVDVLMFFFRYSDRRSFRRSGRCTYVFSGVQTEEVSDDQVDVLMFFRCSDRRSFRRSGRCTYVFSGVQTEEVSDDQVDVLMFFSGVQTEEVSDDQVDVLMFFPVFRPKKFPTIRSMYLCFSGVQTEEVSDDQVDVPVSVFRPISFPFQTDCSFKTVSLPILTGILVLYPVGANFYGSFVFNPFWRPGLLFDRANCLKSSLRGHACVCLKLSQAGKVLQVRQLVEVRDMQSIPHYSCCVIPLLTLLCVDALGYKPKILYKVYSVRVFEYRRVPTFWTHAHLSISSPWPGIRAVRSHPHFILSSASP